MAEPTGQNRDAKSNGPRYRRFGTGRNFEDLCNEVYRHGACLMRDLERIESYLEAVSRKRDNA
jgi:hypothetical protein